MSPERRRFPRAAQPLAAQCRLADAIDSSWLSAMVVNLSASGMRLRIEVPFEDGIEVEVSLQPPGFREALVLRARVVWQQMHAPGVVEHGVELSHVSPGQQEQLDQLVVFLRQGRGGEGSLRA